MLQNLTNLTKLNLTLQYCQPIEKGKLTASEDEAMKMQQLFGRNKMQEKWDTTRCIEIHEEKYFISWEQNQFRIQIPCACVKFYPPWCNCCDQKYLQTHQHSSSRCTEICEIQFTNQHYCSTRGNLVKSVMCQFWRPKIFLLCSKYFGDIFDIDFYSH